jgi:Rrf2 family protein
MISLACLREEDLNSENLAKNLETNPAFIRKIMAKLSKAGLIETRRGKSGGVSLARPAKEISLKDIYLAVNEQKSLAGIKKAEMSCPINCSAQSILLKLSTQMEKAHLLILSRIKLSHLTKEIKV